MADAAYDELVKAARALLAAMNRQWGTAPFSLNVREARDELAALVGASLDDDDRAERF